MPVLASEKFRGLRGSEENRWKLLVSECESSWTKCCTGPPGKLTCDQESRDNVTKLRINWIWQGFGVVESVEHG